MKILLLSLVLASFTTLVSASSEQLAEQYDDLVLSLKNASNAEDLSGRSQYTLLVEYDLRTGLFSNGHAEVYNPALDKVFSISAPDDLDIAKKKVSYSEFVVHDELNIEFNVVEYKKQGVSRGADTASISLLRDKRSGAVTLKLIGAVEERGTILYSNLTQDKFTIAFIENRNFDGNRPTVLTVDLNKTLDMRTYICRDKSLKDCKYSASYVGGKFIQNGFRH